AIAASRRARPGVTASVLGTARVERKRGRVALALVRRERLVLDPVLAQVLVVALARQLGELLVVLARLAALLGREARPGLHAPGDALLLLGRHLRIAFGDRDPFLPALGLERVPVGAQRREHLLLAGGELGPGGAGVDLLGRLGGGLLGRLGAGLRAGSRSHAEGEHGEKGARHHSSSARFFSQFWKPRSR